MWKFVAGALMGIVLALVYVRFGVALPEVLQAPGALHGGVVSAAVEGELYALDGDEAARLRALEIYFANRPADAAADAAAGHPLLRSLHDDRAQREARRLLARWSAHDEVLAQPALRGALERRHGTADPDVLRTRMRVEELSQEPFLALWLERCGGQVSAADMEARVKAAARDAAALRKAC